MKFELVYVPISGFREDTGRETGTELAWHRCRKLSNPLAGIFTPREWNSDWSECAALIQRNTHEASRIVVSAYSWGFGHGFLKLCKELNERDRTVHHVIAVDPVNRIKGTPTRPKIAAALFNPLSMVGLTEKGRDFWPIKVPANVQEVTYFRQSQNVPAGRRLKAESSIFTKINEPIWLDEGHTSIDEHPRVLDTIFEAVKAAAEGEA